MTEILTESFCERCGTRYTFESARPKTRLKNVRVLSRGFKNFVMSDDTSMDEAMAAARSETDRELTSHQLDAFHKTFNFCMSCRQYTCPNCWNEVENRCLSCAPHLGTEIMPAAFPDLPSGPLVSDEALYSNGNGYPSNGTNGTSATDHASELIGVAEVQARHDEEVDAAARLAALTAPVVEAPPAQEIAPKPPIAATSIVEEAPTAEVAPVVEPPVIEPPVVETPVVEPPVVAPPVVAPAVAAAAGEPRDEAATNPYDAVDTKTPSWLAKLVAVNQVDEALDDRATPAPAPAPAPAAVQPAAPVRPADPAPIIPPAPAPEPVAAVAAEPVAEVAPEPVSEPAVAPVEPISIAPEPESLIEPAAAVAAAGLAAADIHDPADDTEAVEDKAAAQTSGLLERFRPAATIAAAAAIMPDPVMPEATAPPMPAARPAEAAPVPSPTAPATQTPVVPPPVAPEPAPAQPSWVPSAPESNELAAAASATPAPPVRDDVVAQPVWQMVAPDDATPVVDATPPAPSAPSGRPEPQWPTQPEWPSATASSTGLPFLGRPAQPTGGLDALWAESTREVSRQSAGNRAAGGVQPCVSCGLSLSANARFCRRCGTPQGA